MNGEAVDSFSSLSTRLSTDILVVTMNTHTHTLPTSSSFSSGSPLQMDFSCGVIIIINLGDRFASEQLKTHLLQCQAEAAAGGGEKGRHSHAAESTDDSVWRCWENNLSLCVCHFSGIDQKYKPEWCSLALQSKYILCT